MDFSNNLKKRLKRNTELLLSQNPALKAVERSTAFIYADVAMNFNQNSYAAILKKPEWKARLEKKHTSFNDGTLEMQSSNSSDALLMNIFCHPRFPSWTGAMRLLGIKDATDIRFGWNPYFVNEDPAFRTEIDLKIGQGIFEAKLTESGFTEKALADVELYEGFAETFEAKGLLNSEGYIDNYQLVRNILTAKKYDMAFTLLVDQERTDLIRCLFETTKCIMDIKIRQKVRFVTWQEIAAASGAELKDFLLQKYL